MIRDAGSIRELAALQTLLKNGWFDWKVEGLELRIRLGPKAKRLREGKQSAAAAD